jgi:putative GTP pyrophosphokinase
MYRIRDWERILIPYEQAVEELKVKLKSLRDEFRKMNEYSPIEFVTGRVKKINSILEKAKRNGIDEDDIEDRMEDIAGIRIMCQFVDDIYSVVDLLRIRDGKDLKIETEKDYVHNQKDSGYRSYHIIIRYPVQTAFGEKEILAEIQIRTLAMNFWATIEHSLKYKYKKEIPVEVRSRLMSASDAAFRLDKEMCEIRNEVIEAQVLFEEKSNTISSIVNNIQLLNLLGQQAEAMKFQIKFDELWHKGSLDELEDLLKNIKLNLARYQAFD